MLYLLTPQQMIECRHAAEVRMGDDALTFSPLSGMDIDTAEQIASFWGAEDRILPVVRAAMCRALHFDIPASRDYIVAYLSREPFEFRDLEAFTDVLDA
jgi:hypothetical protein